MAKFEIVKRFSDNPNNVVLPVRATVNSAGYDFTVCERTIVPSYRNIIRDLKGFIARNIPYFLRTIDFRMFLIIYFLLHIFFLHFLFCFSFDHFLSF